MAELQETREQLKRIDDPTLGLPALHGELTQSRLKIQEAIQMGVTGLREENRELRRRQDRMISDLNETRADFRELLDLADTLRAATAPHTGPHPPSDTPEDLPETAHPQPAEDSRRPAGHDPGPAPDETPSVQHTEPDINQQGESMEGTDQQPQPKPGDDNQNLALKNAIEAAYHGVQPPAQPSTAAQHAPSSEPEDVKVVHGVLLLKAAGVASAELVAHRDTWEWLSALAVGHAHFRTPPAVEDVKEGRIQTVLSGRALIALLIELWNTRHDATPLEADWALATTAYNRVSIELAGVRGQGETIRIVLDDGLPHSDD
ncbi:hypothetical protein ACIRPT_37070 [Streptomyces sp. NPDC101227]|uniref:hypothetical protein n=1 Tax=Streptomyces sp. NPDC101227 TaxID=3366136 RepID=UPI003807BFE6